MPYNIKNYKGSTVANVLEGTVNTQTSLTLIGQNYKNYGQLIAENFVHILENFSTCKFFNKFFHGNFFSNNNKNHNIFS